MDYKSCDIFEATHVKTVDGQIHRILSKWGIVHGQLEPPSRGGFGCICLNGERVNMWQAAAYYKEDPEFSGKRSC